MKGHEINVLLSMPLLEHTVHRRRFSTKIDIWDEGSGPGSDCLE